MSPSSVDIDGVGTLTHRGRSKHWTGEIRLSDSDDPISLAVHGEPDGPTDAQVAALRAVLGSSAEAIRAESASGLEALLAESGFAAARAWDAFRMSGLEVPRESYDRDAVHVLVVLEHLEYPDDFMPAIDMVDGRVVEVLSGT